MKSYPINKCTKLSNILTKSSLSMSIYLTNYIQHIKNFYQKFPKSKSKIINNLYTFIIIHA